MSVDKSLKGKGSVDLTVGSPTKCIILFTLPLLLGNIFQLCYSWTDAIILGKIKGDALQFSALSASMPIVNLLITVVMGFLAGAVVLIGQKYGMKKYQDVKACFSTLIRSLLIITSIISVIGFIFAEPLLRLINVSENFIPYSVVYLRFYFIGLIFMVLYNTFAQVLRSLGNSKMPLYALIACVIVNIVLDYIFVKMLNMNIEGVALATMIAQCLSALIMFIYIQKKVDILSIGKEQFIFDKQLFNYMVKLGVPSMIQNMCACVGYLVINGLVNSRGDSFTTAFGLGNRIDELLTQILNSFGIAITTYSAQNMGKGDIDRIKRGYKSGMILLTVTMFALAFIVFYNKSTLINIFLDTQTENDKVNISEVIKITSDFLSIYLPSYFLMGWMTTTSGLIRGTGCARLAMQVNIFSFIIRVLSAYLLNSYIYGIFFASPIGWFAGSFWAIMIYLKGNWKLKKHKVQIV